MEVKLHLGWKVEGIKQFLYFILLFLMWPSDYSVLTVLHIFTNTSLVTGNYPFSVVTENQQRVKGQTELKVAMPVKQEREVQVHREVVVRENQVHVLEY